MIGEEIEPEIATNVGEAVQVGDLRIVPVSILEGEVELEHRDGDGNLIRELVGPVLRLTLRLVNTSNSRSFAPFDRGFLRDTDQGPASSQILAGGYRIGGYPLAESSELSIVDQSFDAIAPGESKNTLLVSDRDPDLTASRSWTWRFKVRVSPDQTRTIGVRISPDELR